MASQGQGDNISVEEKPCEDPLDMNRELFSVAALPVRRVSGS